MSAVWPMHRWARSISSVWLARDENDKKDGKGFISESLLDSCDCHWACKCVKIWERMEGLRSVHVGWYLEEGCEIEDVSFAAMSILSLSGILQLLGF